MSSPGTSKTSRPMTPLPKDYHTAVSQMETNNLLRSTLTEDCRTQKGDQRTCLLCGLSYFWRPSRCRTHLGLEGSTKQVQVCKPYPEHCDRFSEVVRELRERDTQTEQAAREVTKRSLESGAPDDAINVENFCTKARVSDARPFKIVRTRDEVDMQWARAAVSAGLPMSFIDNKEVLRWSRGFPASRSHSLDSRRSPRSSLKKERLSVALRCSRVWRQGLRRKFQ